MRNNYKRKIIIFVLCYTVLTFLVVQSIGFFITKYRKTILARQTASMLVSDLDLAAYRDATFKLNTIIVNDSSIKKLSVSTKEQDTLLSVPPKSLPGEIDNLFLIDTPIKSKVLQPNYTLNVYYDISQTIVASLVSWIALILFSLLPLFWLYRFMKRSSDQQIINRRNEAIAQTSQMLAHDVRKPFSMMEALIEIIGDTTDPIEIKKTMRENLPSVSQAIVSVNGMIQDVMEIGAESNMTTEPTDARKFIEHCLRQLFQYRNDIDIELSFKLPVNLSFDIAAPKYQRVFSNIVGNAVEHMKARGKIWLTASEPVDGKSEFVVGNSNTFIPKEDLAKLFEAFFTKDKAGGTGLGLAIAKKIVQAHGGEITCRSDKIKGTEFIFTIPAFICDTPETIDLPNSARAFYKAPKLAKFGPFNELSRAQLEAIAGKAISIAIADDEQIYIDSLISNLRTFDLKLSVSSYNSGTALVSSLQGINQPDIIICDVDFGTSAINGFETCKLLRKNGYKGLICVNSNRGSLEFQPLAVEAGADFFVPKPMSKLDLFNMIKGVVSKDSSASKTKRILLFEDEPIFQRRWKAKAKPAEVIVVKSWQEFEEQHPNFDYSEVSYVVMDLHLADGENGMDAAKKINDKKPGLNIYLSTNADGVEDPENLLEGIVSKDPVTALKEINKG